MVLNQKLLLHRRSLRPYPINSIQAWGWLERGNSTDGQSFPAARSRFLETHSDSISMRPSRPMGHLAKLWAAMIARERKEMALPGFVRSFPS